VFEKIPGSKFVKIGVSAMSARHVTLLQDIRSKEGRPRSVSSNNILVRGTFLLTGDVLVTLIYLHRRM